METKKDNHSTALAKKHTHIHVRFSLIIDEFDDTGLKMDFDGARQHTTKDH